MDIVVCVKPVKGDINPFDESALEFAFSVKNAKITVVCMGPVSALPMLKRLSRLPVDRLLLLSDNAFAGSDTLATGYILSSAIMKLKPDLVICGKQSIDGDTAQVGVLLSAMLDYSLVTNVLDAVYIDGELFGTSRNGNKAITEKSVVTVEKSRYLRFPSIFSKEKEVEVKNAADLEVDLSKCGLKGSPTRVLKTYENERGRRKCKFISFNELFEVIEKERNKKSPLQQLPAFEKKLDEIWIVDNKTEKIANALADKIVVLPKLPPGEIVKEALLKKPKVILWTADSWGRENAPVVQAMLNTGLCADCTNLETDGEKLYMYRPAGVGSIIAKIECRTLPAMATVRCADESTSSIVVSAGKGVSDCIEDVKDFARVLNARFGASRPIVDSGLAEYESQIGLTGKTVRPSVYIACGISGEVQHTCAIEDSGTVIAINTDKNAKIFDYADYGIAEDFKNIKNLTQYIKLNGGCKNE